MIARRFLSSQIEAGAVAVHLEDRLAAEKKRGHPGGTVPVPVSQQIRTYNSAHLARDRP